MRVKRILVVDDDASTRDLLQVSFETLRSDYEVIAAANGLAALDLLHHYRFDLVITDYQMPRMNGLELIDHLRQQWPETPVVLMSGHRSDELDVEVGSLGLAGYIRKPFDPAQVLELVDEVLGRGKFASFAQMSCKSTTD